MVKQSNFPSLNSVECIWDHATHNAMTDLIFYRQNFYCVFRESDSHAGGANGQIRVLKSPDAHLWSPIALIQKEGTDLRDPMLSITPDGRLMLNMGGSIYVKDDLQSWNSQVCFSKDGILWTPIQQVELKNEWIWRVTWHQGTGYGFSYHPTNFSDLKKPWKLSLFQTKNGLDYTLLKKFTLKDKPSEATIRFIDSGMMVVLLRTGHAGLIGSSSHPYTKWQWTKSHYHLGGPNFLILPDGKMWAGSRLHTSYSSHTALFKMNLDGLDPVVIFPSNGDTSYPGMVCKNRKLYISYYSTHEKKTAIYLAILDL